MESASPSGNSSLPQNKGPTPLPLYTITLKQAVEHYRRGSKCGFFIHIDDKSLEGECLILNRNEEKMATPISERGLHLLIKCSIEGESGTVNDRFQLHNGIMFWKDGKGYQLDQNSKVDFKIPLLTVKINSPYRNQKHFVAVHLYSNGQLYAQSDPPLMINFRPGKRLSLQQAMEKRQQKQKEKAVQCSPPSSPSLEPKEFEDWDTERMVEEFKELHNKRKISETYEDQLKGHNIQGAVLKMMKREDWKDVGIKKVGDLKAIEKYTEEL